MFMTLLSLVMAVMPDGVQDDISYGSWSRAADGRKSEEGDSGVSEEEPGSQGRVGCPWQFIPSGILFCSAVGQFWWQGSDPVAEGIRLSCSGHTSKGHSGGGRPGFESAVNRLVTLDPSFPPPAPETMGSQPGLG